MTLQGGNVILTFGESRNPKPLGLGGLGAWGREAGLDVEHACWNPEPGYRYSEFANGHWGGRKWNREFRNPGLQGALGAGSGILVESGI